MTNILFFIAGIALGFYIKGKEEKSITPKQVEELREMRKDAKEAFNERTEKRKERILKFMENESAHDEELKTCNLENHKKGIVCADVEKLLDVSGGTARKYLNELESENKIKQIGKTGRDVYYTLNT